MQITVRYLGYLAGVARREETLSVEPTTSLTDLLDVLAQKRGRLFQQTVYDPKEKKIKSDILVLVNGFTIDQLDGVETKLKRNDLVLIMPTISGG
jgi:molybdopterin converting factor small subunit